MINHIIAEITSKLNIQFPTDARVLPSIALMRKLNRVSGEYEYIPISCNETPSTCRPDLVELAGMSESDAIFIWFGAEGETMKFTPIVRGNTYVNETTLTIYVWYNGNRIAGNYCDIEQCVLINVIEALNNVNKDIADIESVSVDYSLSAIRAFEAFEKFAYFPYGFFSVSLQIKSKINTRCTPCQIITEQPC